MPNGDGTGPYGDGSLRGRCPNNGQQMRFGRRCAGRRAYFQPAALSKEEQKKILESELKDIDEEKRAIEKKLTEIA